MICETLRRIMIIKEILEICAGFLTPMIAVLAVWIAWQQHRTNRDKLRLNLYDKRFDVFRALMELLAFIVREGNITLEKIYEFRANTNESSFLFDKDISEYLETVRQKAVKFYNLEQKLHHSDLPVGEERDKAAKDDSELLRWFFDQFKVSESKFGKYLSFKIKH